MLVNSISSRNYCGQYIISTIYATSVKFLIGPLLLDTTWARVSNIDYWHCSGLEPEGHRPEGSKPIQYRIGTVTAV